MNFKPSDFQITVFEFFSVMLPGAVLCYFLGTQYGQYIFGYGHLFHPLDSTEKWIVFIFSSYLLGHILFAIGSYVDRWYDKNKIIVKKRNKNYDLCYLAAHTIQERLLDGLLSNVLDDRYVREKFDKRNYWTLFRRSSKAPSVEIPNEAKGDSEEAAKQNDNTLFTYVTLLLMAIFPGKEKRDVAAIDRKLKDEFVNSQEILNTYKFVKAVMLLYFPGASMELTYFEASQKFFRTLFIGLLLIAIMLLGHLFIYFLWPSRCHIEYMVADFSVGAFACFILSWICFRRYLDQRFKTTQLAYELLIAYDKLNSKMKG